MSRNYVFQGNTITYKGQQIVLCENILYLDGTLDASIVSEYPYVFNDIRALVELVNTLGQTIAAPITVYIAPYVYWIDDPDAMDTVQCREGDVLPFGLKVACDTLKLVGLCEGAADVVIAGNRGQSHGSNGNYTMFYFRVRDLELSNLTIGNYCSIDLVYSPKPELNHTRRTNAITQAQLAWQQGDKLWARNCNFISRLNLLPVCGGERCLYESCHFESTDDALNGKAVYIGCDFDFYGNRPFYCTRESGAVFLDCVFKSRIIAESVERIQYFTKEGGPVVVVDCEYQSLRRESTEIENAVEGIEKAATLRVAWTKYPAPSLKCYQSNVHYDGESVIIGGEEAMETVLMEGKEIENAYRLQADGRSIYNTYNLLRGKDDWDPLGVKDAVLNAGREAIPTRLTIKTSGEEIVSGENTVMLEAEAFYFYGEQVQQEAKKDMQISYKVNEPDRAYVRLTDKGDGICLVEGMNEETLARKVIVHAATPQGLEAAVELKVCPSLLEAPTFVEMPKVEISEGLAKVNYKAQLQGYEEQSGVSWYRCKESDGRDAVLVAVSGDSVLGKEYSLEKEDVGYYLMAKVEPCHSRSHKGIGVCAVSDRSIAEGDVSSKSEADGCKMFVTDFSTMPTVTQDKIIPGFWTVDEYRPIDTANFGKWETQACPGQGSKQIMMPWKYGETGNGSIGKGLYQNVQGARLMYTPLEGAYGDMTLRIKLDPAKTAGQGFGSADQYLDLCVKFDTKTLSGYGVRILRSPEASDGVRFLFVKYEEGETTYLNEGILTSCFLTGCEVVLEVKGNIMSVHAESETVKARTSATKYVPFVDMEVEITGNEFGGVAIQHTGTPGTGGWQNTTMLHSLEFQAKKIY